MVATCGIRQSNEAFENTQSRLLLLADSEEEAYNLKPSPAHLHKGGNVHSAEDPHRHQTVDGLLSSVAPPLLRHLDQTGHSLSSTGDADRPGP